MEGARCDDDQIKNVFIGTVRREGVLACLLCGVEGKPVHARRHLAVLYVHMTGDHDGIGRHRKMVVAPVREVHIR